LSAKDPGAQTGSDASAARGWLARLHPGLFAIPLGTLGLAGSWRRLAPLGVAGATGISDALLAIGLAILALLFALWLTKLLRHWPIVKSELEHPVQGAMLALLPVSALLAVTLLLPGAGPAAHDAALAVSLAALALQGAIASRVVSRLVTGQMPGELVTPALYLPIVTGGFVGAMAMAALGYHGWGALLIGLGLGAWALLEIRILNRLFSGPLPVPLRTTVGIEMAPATVGSLAAATLWPQLPADILLIGLGVASGPVLAVMARWRWWGAVPFSFGFWSFSFPLAALAAGVAEAVTRGGWPVPVAQTAVLLASAVIGFLAVRTLALLLRGRLLPPG
jgi:tellurite resistance protein